MQSATRIRLSAVFVFSVFGLRGFVLFAVTYPSDVGLSHIPISHLIQVSSFSICFNVICWLCSLKCKDVKLGNPYTMSPNYKIPKINTGELPSRDLVTWHVHFIKSVCFCLRGLLTFSWENSLRQNCEGFRGKRIFAAVFWVQPAFGMGFSCHLSHGTVETRLSVWKDSTPTNPPGPGAEPFGIELDNLYQVLLRNRMM